MFKKLCNVCTVDIYTSLINHLPRLVVVFGQKKTTYMVGRKYGIGMLIYQSGCYPDTQTRHTDFAQSMRGVLKKF